MAEKKKPMGDDPLAWLSEGEVEPQKKPVKRTRKRRATRNETVKVKNEIEIIEASFAALSPKGTTLATRFFENLFANHPEIKPVFGGVSKRAQQKNMLASLALLVQNLHKPEILNDYLLSLAAMHVQHGGTDRHYPIFIENLLVVMAEVAGDEWTKETQHAWHNILNKVETIMLKAFESTETKEMTNQDNTQQQLADLTGQIDAISKSMGVISFDMDGTIIDINQNFLGVVGYKRKDVIGQHHRMFAEAELAASAEYTEFWAKLNRGEFDSGEYKRIGNGGKEIWLQASYNPIMDLNGKPFKVVKYATDITDQIKAKAEMAEQIIEVRRLQSAVEGAESALMICDADRVITFANPAVIKLLEKRSTELRSVFPKFDVSKIVGTCIDDFHKDPSHQAAILSDPTKLPYSSKIQLLNIHFYLNVSAIVDADGKLMGNMVEWRDITDGVNTEMAIQALITAASTGQLEDRIDTSEYTGFMKTIADGVNNIMDTVLPPVQETIKIAEALSRGDLTQKLDGDYQGMFGELADALNSTVDKLAETVEEINESADSISTAATEISEGNLDLSQRTESQASSLEETASSMEELTSTVRQNADNARQANQLASSSREQAEQGGSVIKEAIEAMAGISASSKKVTDIIGVIDEIAFQTNLLALNAAVEAARAGEQGRGFAVVASEVRNLAQRSASAAKEIKELINDSGEKVKEGSMLVDESGRTLEEIVASSKKVGDIISEIAAAGSEQTQGIEQVNKAVSQMDEMTQQNAALVEEAAAASESLDEQGRGLQKLISFFTVSQSSQASIPEVKAEVAPKKAPAAKKAKPAAKKAKATLKPKPAAVSQDDDEWDEF